MDFLTPEGRWLTERELRERGHAGFNDQIIGERWITKNGRAIFVASLGEDPPTIGDIAATAEEHEHAAEAHRRASEAMKAVGKHEDAEKHNVAMIAHKKAADAARSAQEASEAANFGMRTYATQPAGG